MLVYSSCQLDTVNQLSSQHLVDVDSYFILSACSGILNVFSFVVNKWDQRNVARNKLNIWQIINRLQKNFSGTITYNE